MDLLPIVLAFYPVLYVALLCHELGHVVLGRWQGFVITSFGLGIGRPFLVWNWRNARVYLCRKHAFNGLTFMSAPQLFPSRRQTLWMLSGGMLAHALLTLLSLSLWWGLPWGESVWLLAAGINASLGVMTMVPFKATIGDVALQSDGFHMVQVLRNGMLSNPAPDRVRLLRTLRGFWQEIGDNLGLYTHLLDAAEAWMQLGNAEEAERLCAEAEALVIEHSTFTRAYGKVVCSAVARAAGKLEASAASLEEALQGFSALDHEAGLFVVAWERAELKLKQGEAAEAAASLHALACHRVPRNKPGLQTALLVARLCASSALPDGNGMAQLLAEYETARRRHHSDTLDLQVFSNLAGMYMRQQDLRKAERSYRDALAAAQKLHETLADPADQAAFLRGQSALLTGASECLQHLGKADEADRLPALFPSTEERKRQDLESREQRNRRRHRIGWLLTAVNLVVMFVIGLVFGQWDRTVEAWHAGQPAVQALLEGLRELERQVMFLGLVLLLFVFFFFMTLLFQIVWFLLGRVLAPLRRHGGGITIMLALLPWLIVFVTLLASMQE